MAHRRKMVLAGLVALAVWADAARAQEAQPPVAAPEKFKDWELFCPEPMAKDKPRICEVRTIITGKEGARLGALAIALNPDPGAQELPMIATALLPLGVDLTLAPALKIGEGKPLTLQFRRCLQRGCQAVALIDAEYLNALRGGTIAKVAVGIGGGKNAVFEFSLAGFSAAHDAIRQRAGKS
jgi:invasion protein IalB